MNQIAILRHENDQQNDKYGNELNPKNGHNRNSKNLHEKFRIEFA